MRRRILISIAAFFYLTGIVAFARRRTRQADPCLIILNYHRATGGDLRRHLLYLRRHYRIMHIEAALEELYATRKSDQPATQDRRTPLVLTFDDGYQDNYTHAFPLAQELQIPLSIYLIPGYIESGDHFWWLEGKRLSQRTQLPEVTFEGQTYQLKDPADRRTLATWIDHQLRHSTSVAARESFLAFVREKLAVPSTTEDGELPSLPVTWAQVQEMDQSGQVSFGAHTMHHPILAYLSDPAEVLQELTDCRTVLEQRLNHPVRSLAYPVGQMQHISASVQQAVQAAGYSWALTTTYGFNTSQNSPLTLQRIEADVDQHWMVVAAEAAGLWGFFSRLRWLPFVRTYLTNAKRAK